MVEEREWQLTTDWKFLGRFFGVLIINRISVARVGLSLSMIRIYQVPTVQQMKPAAHVYSPPALGCGLLLLVSTSCFLGGSCLGQSLY
jgi:hypothetical protein